ncbi:MAG TPA: hypothetical protein VJ912_03245 [Candidatus Nanoarchaeia archaeon]|nr:hypothetical protein [Candidatus Nanoarchaeia archaeon]
MGNKRFGYFKQKQSGDIGLFEFNKETFEEKGKNKFVQFYFNNIPYIMAGNNLFHRDIFKKSLEKLGIEYNTKRSHIGNKVPCEKGDFYKLSGAGDIKFHEDRLNFDGCSSEYMDTIPETNKEHLEDFFGKEKISEIRGFWKACFLVDF